MIFSLTLDPGVLGQSPNLGSVRHGGRLCLRAVGVTIGPLLEALIVLHVQGHVAFVALEAAFVPEFIETPEALDRINCLFASSTLV